MLKIHEKYDFTFLAIFLGVIFKNQTRRRPPETSLGLLGHPNSLRNQVLNVGPEQKNDCPGEEIEKFICDTNFLRRF